MLKLGSQKISSLCVGGEKIKKAYVGGDLVFGEEKGGGHDLPAGYTELEYITIGPSLTFSGFLLPLLDQNSVYTFDVEIEKWWDYGYSSYYAPHILYAYTIASKTEYDMAGIWMENNALYASARETTSASPKIKSMTNDTHVPQKMILEYDVPNHRAGVNGVFTDLLAKPANSSNVYLGSYYNANNQLSNRWGDASMKVYGVKAKNAAYAVPTYNCDWIPAKNANGIVGFYDLVSNSFKTPRTGEAMAGPEI